MSPWCGDTTLVFISCEDNIRVFCLVTSIVFIRGWILGAYDGTSHVLSEPMRMHTVWSNVSLCIVICIRDFREFFVSHPARFFSCRCIPDFVEEVLLNLVDIIWPRCVISVHLCRLDFSVTRGSEPFPKVRTPLLFCVPAYFLREYRFQESMWVLLGGLQSIQNVERCYVAPNAVMTRSALYFTLF